MGSTQGDRPERITFSSERRPLERIKLGPFGGIPGFRGVGRAVPFTRDEAAIQSGVLVV